MVEATSMTEGSRWNRMPEKAWRRPIDARALAKERALPAILSVLFVGWMWRRTRDGSFESYASWLAGRESWPSRRLVEWSSRGILLVLALILARSLHVILVEIECMWSSRKTRNALKKSIGKDVVGRAAGEDRLHGEGKPVDGSKEDRTMSLLGRPPVKSTRKGTIHGDDARISPKGSGAAPAGPYLPGSPTMSLKQDISSPSRLKGYIEKLEREFDEDLWQKEGPIVSPVPRAVGQIDAFVQRTTPQYKQPCQMEPTFYPKEDSMSLSDLQFSTGYGTEAHPAFRPVDAPSPANHNGARPAAYRTSPSVLGLTSPMGVDTMAMQSPIRKVDDVLARLGSNYQEISAMADRLREWFSSMLLKPLHELAAVVHSRVASEALKLGFKELTQLPPLARSDNVYKSTVLNANVEEMVLEHYKAQLENIQRQLQQKTTSLGSPWGGTAWGGNQQEQQQLELQKYAVSSCLHELTNYQKLRSVLRGQYYPGFMQQLPVDYIASRISVLAKGTCCESFEWDRGGDWCGYPWNAEVLPTDSHLLFYLFAVYLDAPEWNFEAQPHKGPVGPGGPLFIGQLPARCPSKFVAILPGVQRMLPVRTSTPSSGLILAGSRLLPPHFTLGLGADDEEIKLGGQNGVFTALSILLFVIDRFEGSLLGSLPLAASLGLERVLHENNTQNFAFV